MIKFIKNFCYYSVIFAFITICMGNQILTAPEDSNVRNELFEKLDLYATVLALIQNSYVEEVSSKDLIYGSLTGLLPSLDPHSQFLPPDLYKEIQIDTGGEFGGLGLEIVVKDKYLVVVTPMVGTPAEHAGIQPGDKIIKISGEMIDVPVLDEVVKKLRGPVGSKVEVTLFRPSTKQYLTVEMTREKIKIQSVINVEVLKDTSIGYIKITRFQETTSAEFKDALKILESKGIKGIILDLRNNPGGLLEEGIKVASLIVGGNKLIVSTKGRIPEQNAQKYSDKDFKAIEYPLVILINDGSASASEVVSGAVQDWKKGIILGQTSFGKASVQSLIPLKDGSAVRLTTAKYYTPKDRQIHGKGIEPDVKAELSKEDVTAIIERLKKMKNGEKVEGIYLDSQIKSAIDVINQANNGK